MEKPFVDNAARDDRVAQVMVGSFHDEQAEPVPPVVPEAATAVGVRETLSLFLLNKIGLGGLYRPKGAGFPDPGISGEAAGGHTGFHPGSACPRHAGAHLDGGCGGGYAAFDYWGVDGMITNYPRRLRGVLEGRDL